MSLTGKPHSQGSARSGGRPLLLSRFLRETQDSVRGTGSSTRVLFIKLPAPGVGLLTLPSGDCHCHLLTDAQSLAANDVL